jgi:hypothetical protein
MWRFVARHRIWAAIVTLALLFAVFEVSVRLAPANAVRYDIVVYTPAGPPGPHLQGVITDSATIARWRAAMTAHPLESFAQYTLRHIQGVTCAGGTMLEATYTFTWHGLPIEVVSGGIGCLSGFQVSSGGLPDWNIYAPDPLPHPRNAYLDEFLQSP